MANQIFVFDNRSGSKLIFHLASNTEGINSIYPYSRQEVLNRIAGVIQDELGKTDSTLVQVVITKG